MGISQDVSVKSGPVPVMTLHRSGPGQFYGAQEPPKIRGY